MPAVELTFDQIVELVQQLSDAERSRLLQRFASEPAATESFASPEPAPEAQLSFSRRAQHTREEEVEAALVEPSQPPPPPREVAPPPAGSNLLSRFSGLGQESSVAAGLSSPTALEALQQANRLGDSASAHDRLGGLKNFTPESRAGQALAKPGEGSPLSRLTAGKPAASPAWPAPKAAAPEPPPAPPPAPQRSSSILNRFGGGTPEPAPESPAPSGHSSALDRLGGQTPEPPAAPEAPPARASGGGGDDGGSSSILRRFSGGASAPAPAAPASGSLLGQFGSESRLPAASTTGGLFGRFGSEPRQDPPEVTSAPAPQAPAPAAPRPAAGSGLLGRFSAEAVTPAIPGAGSLLNRFGSESPAPPPTPPVSTPAVPVGLMGRFAEATAEPPPAPGGGSLLGRFGESTPAAAAGSSFRNRFAAAAEPEPPPAPEPEPEPEPEPPLPPPAPAADAGAHWERGLHQLFANVRRQSSYIAREELLEHVSAAIEEVRQQP